VTHETPRPGQCRRAATHVALGAATHVALGAATRVALAAALALACAEGAEVTRTAPATLVVTNARVWTGDPERPWAEAVAVRGETIAAVGSAAEIAAFVGATTEVIDAGAALVTPGFVDAHVHFLEGGFRLSSVQLRDAATPDAFRERIAAFARAVPAGTWITGGDWDHELWGGELPTRDWIDEVTPDHPVWVNRLDGHMALANTRALESAGVTAATADPDGGTVVRDPSGRATGVLKDNAMALVARVVPKPPPELEDRALDAAMSYVAERGVTSVHHMGTWDDLEVFERAHAAGRLRTRIYAAVPLDTWERLAQRVAELGRADPERGRGDDWLRWGMLKGFVDGSLGSHTAAFFEPFTDAPGDRGLLVNTEADLRAWIEGADEAALHVAVHAIGDRANALLLDLYAGAMAKNGARDRRFRIEHAQHLRPADVPRFAELGVLPSMQPYHAIDDGRWADRVIGPERAKGTYAFRSLLDAGARVAFGSDWFVAPPTPLDGIYAAVTRRTLDDAHPDGWVPEQKIGLEEALRAYTTAGAFASFEEGRKGVLRPGTLADLVVLDRDLFAIPVEEVREAVVAATIVGGRVTFRRDRAPTGRSKPR
jgi:predicted amidohydrolase YtcJ